MTYQWVFDKSNMMGATIVAGTTYPSRTHAFTARFLVGFLLFHLYFSVSLFVAFYFFTDFNEHFGVDLQTLFLNQSSSLWVLRPCMIILSQFLADIHFCMFIRTLTPLHMKISRGIQCFEQKKQSFKRLIKFLCFVIFFCKNIQYLNAIFYHWSFEKYFFFKWIFLF